MTHPIIEALRGKEAQFTELRRYFHQHPEIGFEEHNTSDRVAALLEEWGYEVHRGLAKTGVVGTLKVGNGPKRLGLRADMDALPMQENSGKAWSSTVEGKFHGCGHDGHTTTLLYAAEYLARTRNFNGTLHLIFQPAEELLYGGRVMVEDGLFDLFPCDHIFGLHNMPSQPVGKIGLRDGAMMASSDTLHIEVNGVGARRGARTYRRRHPGCLSYHYRFAVHCFAQYHPFSACRRYRRQYSGRTCPQHHQRQSIDETYRAHAG